MLNLLTLQDEVLTDDLALGNIKVKEKLFMLYVSLGDPRTSQLLDELLPALEGLFGKDPDVVVVSFNGPKAVICTDALNWVAEQYDDDTIRRKVAELAKKYDPEMKLKGGDRDRCIEAWIAAVIKCRDAYRGDRNTT